MDYFRASKKQQADKKVLFILRKYVDEKNDIEWVWEHLFLSPFENGDVGAGDVFFHDIAFRNMGMDAMNTALYAVCEKNKYDAVIHYWQPDWDWWERNPSFKTLLDIRVILNVPIATIWCDTWCESFKKQFEYLLPMYDIAVVTDSPKHVEHVTGYAEKVLNLFPPPDPRYFFDPEWKRDISLSFCGNRNIGWRTNYLNALQQADIECIESGGIGNCSFEDFSNTLKCSKLTINFSHTQSGRKTLKGRVMEALLCGALLLDEENEQTERYLTAYEHYIPFTDENDLIEKIRFYLADHVERQKIAQQGKKRAQQLAHPQFFWGAIMNRLSNIAEVDKVALTRTAEAVPILLEALHPKAEQFETAAPNLANKRVCIWGTGGMYQERYAKWLSREQNNINFIGFIDNNPEKWSQTLDGFPIISPDTLRTTNIDVILFATWAAKEIINRLFAEGMITKCYY